MHVDGPASRRAARSALGTPGGEAPLAIVLAEGGPYHARGHLPAYLERLRATGRAGWADDLVRRYPTESA